jgi:LPXTG-motif cell wall-anchored protein
MHQCIALGIVLLLQAAVAIGAAPAEPKTYKLTPQPLPGYEHVKGASYKGTTEARGSRFLLDNLTTRQPVIVSVTGVDPRDEISLAVFKKGWKEAKRAAATRDGQPAIARFRTYGEAQILVSSASPRPFVIHVTVGDEIVPRAEPAFMPMDQYRKKHPMAWFSWHSPLVWSAIAILALIAAAAFLFFRKRRNP